MTDEHTAIMIKVSNEECLFFFGIELLGDRYIKNGDCYKLVETYTARTEYTQFEIGSFIESSQSLRKAHLVSIMQLVNKTMVIL